MYDAIMDSTSVGVRAPASANRARLMPDRADEVRERNAPPRRAAFGIAAFAIAALVLSACGQNVAIVSATADQTAGGTVVEAAFTQFPDMPIPEGGDVDLEQTLVFGGGNNWFGRLVITTSFGPNEMFGFYANQLPSFGWDVITTLRSTVSVLNVRARRSRRDHLDPEADDSRLRGDRDRLAPRRVPDAHGGAGDGAAGAAQPVSGARARRPAPAQPAPMMVGSQY